MGADAQQQPKTARAGIETRARPRRVAAAVTALIMGGILLRGATAQPAPESQRAPPAPSDSGRARGAQPAETGLAVAYAVTRRGQPAYSPRVALATCCAPLDLAEPLTRKGFSLPLREDGAPLQASDRGDVYYVGSEPRSAEARPDVAPLRLQLPTAAALTEALTARLPAVGTVRFPLLGDAASEAAAAGVAALLAARYGADATTTRLGRGGHQLAMRVCRPSGCVVVKVRRIAAEATAGSLEAVATEAAADLRRDLVMLTAAGVIAANARWLNIDGTPLRATLGGVPLPAAVTAATEGRLARAARLTDESALADGLVEMELVPWRASAELQALLVGNVGQGGVTRDRIWTEAGPAGVSRVHAMGFADRYASPEALGPELSKLRGFVEDCRTLRAVPTIASICRRAAHDFRLVDDLEARIFGLEEMYRRSAPLILRLARQRVGRAVANENAAGEAVEVGLDLNHGRNVGWDPETCQFVIFDA